MPSLKSLMIPDRRQAQTWQEQMRVARMITVAYRRHAALITIKMDGLKECEEALNELTNATARNVLRRALIDGW